MGLSQVGVFCRTVVTCVQRKRKEKKDELRARAAQHVRESISFRSRFSLSGCVSSGARSAIGTALGVLIRGGALGMDQISLSAPSCSGRCAFLAVVLILCRFIEPYGCSK